METRIKLTDQEIDSVMRGFVGKMAFNEGWWWELYGYLQNTASTTFVTNEVMDKLREFHLHAWDDATAQERISKVDAAFAESFRIMWLTLKDLKAEVWQKYGVERKVDELA